MENKNSILIVDDETVNLIYLNHLLSSDYTVYTARNAQEAIERAYDYIPDLILLDIVMPGMNGYEAITVLKNTEKTKNIPVIFITGLNNNKDEEKGLNLGAEDYITKPFSDLIVKLRIQNQIKIKNHMRLVIEKEISEKNNRANMATIHALSKLAESRDDDTGAHIERTSSFCKIIAEKLLESSLYLDTVNEAFIENITRASPLHDIGKVGIKDSILLKPGRLTSDEFEIMKTHVMIGYKTLTSIVELHPENVFIKTGLEISRYHHEKWDGSGYMSGISEESIPLSARIMAVSDVYDALRSDRVYKKAFPHEQTLEIIKEGRGKHFDPVLVDVFVQHDRLFRDIYDRLTNI
jgi:putative two-component system response regulator